MKAADAAIAARVLEHPAYRSCHSLFVYASAGTEVDTHAIIAAAMEQGRTVALPVCHGKGIMDFYVYDGTLRRGRYGIPEPVSDTVITPTSGDVMIVPGLSFTKNGERLGQGGGYYDRYLEKYPCMTIGVCREQLLSEKLPVEWNDLPVRCVITDSAVYEKAESPKRPRRTV